MLKRGRASLTKSLEAFSGAFFPRSIPRPFMNLTRDITLSLSTHIIFPANNVNYYGIVLVTLIVFRLPAHADILCQFYINRNGLEP